MQTLLVKEGVVVAVAGDGVTVIIANATAYPVENGVYVSIGDPWPPEEP